MAKRLEKRWIENDYYHIGKRVRHVKPKKFINEAKLQEFIAKRPWIIFEDLEKIKEYYWISDLRKQIDILCVDSYNDICVVELKNGRFTERDVGQCLNYANWVKDNLSELEKEFNMSFSDEVCIIVVCNDMTKSAQNTIEVIEKEKFLVDVFEFKKISVKKEEILEIICVHSNYR